LVFYLPSLRDAYKNSQLCKSSFVLSAVAVWQFVHSAGPFFSPFQLFRPLRSAGIWAGVSFIIAIRAPGFSRWVLPVGSFIVHHLAVVGYQLCPFRALL